MRITFQDTTTLYNRKRKERYRNWYEIGCSIIAILDETVCCWEYLNSFPKFVFQISLVFYLNGSICSEPCHMNIKCDNNSV